MLSLHGLSHRYASGPALVFPDFEAPAGSRVVLSGPSGSGKSTLIALCAGLLAPQQGGLRVAGVDLRSMTAAERDAWRGATLGVVPQRLHLSASLTVLENLAMPFVSVGLPVDRPRAELLLGELGLIALSGRRPHQLSVGQAQRVALARALVRQPSVLLVDEPTANLDDEAVGAVLQLLDRSAGQVGATLLIATHDARVAQAMPQARLLRLARPSVEAAA